MKKLLILCTSVLAIALMFLTGADKAFAYTHTVTLRLGSRGAQVMELQRTLNQNGYVLASVGAGAPGFETTYFGPITKAAVIRFQRANSLVADGIVGPMTGARLAALTGTGALPAGCTSTSGFSSTTGLPCSGTTSTVPGCLPGYLYSPISGKSCTSTSTGGSTSGALQGGAGDIDLTNSTTGTTSTVKEADSNTRVLAFKAKATGSDIAVSAIKLTFQVNSGSVSNGSDRLERYLDSVSVYQDDTKVGTANVADFSRTSGSPDVYTITIPVSNAVIREDKTSTFSVSVNAADTIDTQNLDVKWDVTLDTLRFTDATGAILSASDTNDVATQTFGFESASAEDKLTVTASTDNPQATNFQIDETSTSDNDLVLAFRLKSGSDSGDVQVNEIPVHIDIANGGSNADAADAVIDSVTMKIGSTTYQSDSDTCTSGCTSSHITNGAGTQTYTFSFDNDQVVIPSDSTVDARVYIKFNNQKSGTVANYDTGTTIVASVNGSEIDAESRANGDTISVTGSATSKTHSLSINAPTFALVGSPTFNSFTQIDGTASGQEDIYLAKFTFDVTAGNDDVYLSSNPSDIGYTISGGATVNSVILEPQDTSLDDNSTDYLITAGSTERFTLSFYVKGNDAANKITLTSLKYGLTDLARNLTVSTGLATFTTPTVYLAK